MPHKLARVAVYPVADALRIEEPDEFGRHLPEATDMEPDCPAIVPTGDCIEADIQRVMDSPECIFRTPLSRLIFSSAWFAQRAAEAGCAAKPWLRGEVTKAAVTSVADQLYGAGHDALIPGDVSQWHRAGYIFDLNIVSVEKIRHLAEALEAAITVFPTVAPALVRYARALREELVRSEIAAQAAVERAVRKERKQMWVWNSAWAALGLAGLAYFFGRSLAIWVGIGFVLSILAIRPTINPEKVDIEIARRCSELGWPRSPS